MYNQTGKRQHYPVKNKTPNSAIFNWNLFKTVHFKSDLTVRSKERTIAHDLHGFSVLRLGNIRTTVTVYLCTITSRACVVWCNTKDMFTSCPHSQTVMLPGDQQDLRQLRIKWKGGHLFSYSSQLYRGKTDYQPNTMQTSQKHATLTGDSNIKQT